MGKLEIMFVNDTHSEKLFYSIQCKNVCLVASGLFRIFTQLFKFYTFHYHVLRVQMSEKCDYDSEYGWLLLSASFTVKKIWVGFCLNTGKRFFSDV